MVRDNPTKLKIAAVGLAIWAVWISGVFGDSGLLQAHRLANVRRDISLRVKALENEKQHLETTLAALDRDSFVQEQVVRETLGFVRDGELIFEFR